MRLARNGVIAAGLLSAGGWALATTVRNHYELRDLDVVGNGVPAVVQIHDPQCPTCRQLQKDMLSAAEDFGDNELLVRVASIDTSEGRALADHHRVSHLTLLLFDARGRVRRVLQGPQDRDVLQTVFAAHAARGSTRGAADSPGN